jgi:hypothetical protein
MSPVPLEELVFSSSAVLIEVIFPTRIIIILQKSLP